MLKTSFCKNERTDGFGEESRALILPHSSVRKQWALQKLVHSLDGWAGFTARANRRPNTEKSNYRFPTENAGMSHSIWQALCSQFSCCKVNRLVLAWVFWLSLTCIKGSFQPVALSQCKRIVRFSSALINCTHSWHKQSIKCKLFVTTLRFFHGCIVEQ